MKVKGIIDNFESMLDDQDKNDNVMKHFMVNRILVRWQQMQKYQNPISVRDVEQPKFGDLRNDSKKKISLLSTSSESSSNSLKVSPPSCYTIKSPESFNQFATTSIFGECLSLGNKAKSQQILKIKQLKNFNCRPIKNIEGVKLDKAQSSLLQKRKKEPILQNKRNIKAIIQTSLKGKYEKNGEQNSQQKQTFQIQETDLQKLNQFLSLQSTKHSKEYDQQNIIVQDITLKETQQGSILNLSLLKEIAPLWNKIRDTLSKTTSCKSEG